MADLNDTSILIAQHGTDNNIVQCCLLPNKANRHGLITGATGTGKTITLQTMAEGFSSQAEPVVRRVSDVWRQAGVNFPLHEVMEAW